MQVGHLLPNELSSTSGEGFVALVKYAVSVSAGAGLKSNGFFDASEVRN